MKLVYNSRSVRLAVLWAAFSSALFPARVAPQISVRDSAQPTGRWRDASLDDYRQHLAALRELTQACARARDVKTCDPTLVGPDDRVPIMSHDGADRRIVRYGWLRVLLYKADEPDKAEQAAGTQASRNRGPGGNAGEGGSAASPRPPPRTTSQLLEDAEARLAVDLAQAGEAVKEPGEHTATRDILRQVLAEREFRNLQQAPESDTVLERVGNWLNHIFAGVDKLRARSAWVGRALVWAFFLAVGALLTWRLMRIERRWRSRLVSPRTATIREASSVREWEAWLADARRAAAAAEWREAIHFMYWASIARLESKRLWPADKARTPREYLALMAPGDPRTIGLAALTRSFERTWYGGRDAGEFDYRQAEQAAAGLISDSAALVVPALTGASGLQEGGRS